MQPLPLEWLREQYETRSARNIAAELHCDKKTVLKYLRCGGVSPRPPALPLHSHLWSFTSEQHEIIEGLLLSDANLHIPPRCRFPRFMVQFTNAADLIQTIQMKFKEIPFHYSNKPAKEVERLNGKLRGHIIRCQACDILTSPISQTWQSYYKRWYPNNQKVVPADLQITPTMLRWAFYGDGTTSYAGQHKNLVEMALCTNGFTRTDNIILKQKLANIGIDMHIKNILFYYVLTVLLVL